MIVGASPPVWRTSYGRLRLYNQSLNAHIPQDPSICTPGASDTPKRKGGEVGMGDYDRQIDNMDIRPIATTTNGGLLFDSIVAGILSRSQCDVAI